ncbi:MAG: phosphoribosylglycinamide formyltransferase [Thiovulaceae bacterium]|nr:phosphoribosylglycinamide formyltransferase [Sulfurimonadaceae bacterium]
MKENKKVVVLFSGAGTNLKNLIDQLHQKSFVDVTIEIVAAITNKPKALGLEIAKKQGIKTFVLDHTLYETREDFDSELVRCVQSYLPDIVVMAGFMRILTPIFTSKVEAINLHPSLLPKYKGAKAIEQSFDSGDSEAGVSVHYVHNELDSGDLILQKSFKRDSDESFESFTQKIKDLEYELLPQAVIKLLTTK